MLLRKLLYSVAECLAANGIVLATYANRGDDNVQDDNFKFFEMAESMFDMEKSLICSEMKYDSIYGGSSSMIEVFLYLLRRKSTETQRTS